jgi:hypothetical protein
MRFVRKLVVFTPAANYLNRQRILVGHMRPRRSVRPGGTLHTTKTGSGKRQSLQTVDILNTNVPAGMCLATLLKPFYFNLTAL